MTSLSDFLLEMPGAAGELARGINATFKYSNPAVAIGSALSLFAMLRSGKIVSPYGHEANLYTFVIAPSGTGKTKAHNIIRRILSEASLYKHAMVEPASDAGLENALEIEPRRLMFWDEAGQAIAALSNDTGYKAQMLQMLLKIYSASGNSYDGKIYAKSSGREQVNVDSPYLTIFGASTPPRFFEAINENFAHDGFLPRCLMLIEENAESGYQIPKPFSEYEVFADIAKQIEENIQPSDLGKLAAVLKNKKQVLRVPIYTKLRTDQFDAKTIASAALAANFWRRAEEKFYKVLIAISDTELASQNEVQWTANLVEFEIETLVRHLKGHLGIQSISQREKEKFLCLVKNEWVSHTALLKATWRYAATRQQKQSWIDECVNDAEIWERSEERVEGSRRNTIFYRITKSV